MRSILLLPLVARCIDNVVVYVDLQNDEISLNFTAGSVSWCCVCGHVVVFGMSVSLW